MDVDEFLRGLDEPPEVMRSMAAFLADRAAFDPATWDADQERAARATVVETHAGKVVPVDAAARRSRRASGRCSRTTRWRRWRRSTAPVVALAAADDETGSRARGPRRPPRTRGPRPAGRRIRARVVRPRRAQPDALPSRGGQRGDPVGRRRDRSLEGAVAMQVVYTPAHLGARHHDRDVHGRRRSRPTRSPSGPSGSATALEADGGFPLVGADRARRGADHRGPRPGPRALPRGRLVRAPGARASTGRSCPPTRTRTASMFEGMSDEAVAALVREPVHAGGRAGFWGLDSAAPLVAGTYVAARAAVDVALTTVDLVLGGETAAYGLCRPPGHHAARSMYGGYCFFNNAAIAAEAIVRATGERVAILDVDYHHGNGTPADLLAPRRRPLRLDPRRPGPPVPVLPRPCRRDRRGRRGRGEPQHPAPRPGRPTTDYLVAIDRALEAIAAVPGLGRRRLARLRHVRARPDRRLRADDRRLPRDRPADRGARPPPGHPPGGRLPPAVARRERPGLAARRRGPAVRSAAGRRVRCEWRGRRLAVATGRHGRRPADAARPGSRPSTSSRRATPTWPAIVDRFGPPPLWDREPGFATLLHIVLEQQVSLAVRAGGLRPAPRRGRSADAGPLPRADDDADAAGDRVQPPEGALRPGARRPPSRSGALDLDGLAGLDDEAVHGALQAVPGHRAVDVDDLPADGARAARRLAGRRHRPGRRRSARSRASAHRPDAAEMARSATPGGRGAPSPRGCSGTTTSAVAAAPASGRRRAAAGRARRTIAACIGVTILSSPPDLPSHVQRIVDEIENEIGEEPGRPGVAHRGRRRGAATGQRPGRGRRPRDPARDRRGPRPPGPGRDAGARPPDVHRADRRLPRRSRSGSSTAPSSTSPTARWSSSRTSRSTRCASTTCCRSSGPPRSPTSRAAGSSACRRSRASSRCTRAGSRSRSG